MVKTRGDDRGLVWGPVEGLLGCTYGVLTRLRVVVLGAPTVHGMNRGVSLEPNGPS